MTNEPLTETAANSTGGATTQQATDSSATKAAPETNANTQQQSTGGETQPKGGEQKPNADDKGAAAQGKGGEQGADDKGKKPDDKKGGEPEKKAPEKYELKKGEGVQLTPEFQTQFETIARELDLPQEAAQKLMDLAPQLNKMYAGQLQEIAQAQSTKWAEETRNDKELGGSGNETAYNDTMALVAKTRAAFATPELLSLLQRHDPQKNPNGTGLGNHPEVVRLFARIGSRLGEDNKFVGGNTTPATEQAGAADKLYANTTSKNK